MAKLDGRQSGPEIVSSNELIRLEMAVEDNDNFIERSNNELC